MRLDFYIDNRNTRYALLKAIWDNKDRLNFTCFTVDFKRQCRITLDLGKYSIQTVVPLITNDRYMMFHVYKRGLLGLYKSYLGGVLIECTCGDSLEALVSDYIDAKVIEFRKSIDEAEETARRKVNTEFIDYLKKNCFASD